MGNPRPYRRRKFLVNKNFQFRVALYVCSWIVALSFIYPLIVYNLFEYFIRYAAVDPAGPNLQELFNTRREVLILLAGTQLAFLLLTFLISIFLAHRIAGPLGKLRSFFARAKEGRYGGELHFRNYDHFQELAADYNEMMASIRARLGQMADQIERALPGSSPESKTELQKVVSSIRSSVEPPARD